MSSSIKNSKNETASLLAWWIWGIATSFYFYEFFLQVSPNVMGSDLRHEFVISATTLGMLSSLYFYAYAGMQIPAGLLMDRFGPRKLLTVAVGLCAVSSLFFAHAHSLFIVGLSRFFIGLGSAFAVIGCFKLASEWFPVRQFAFVTGVTVAVGMCGALMAQSPLAFLVAQVGWRHSMLLMALIGGVIMLMMWFLVKDKPEKQRDVQQSGEPPVSGKLLWQQLKQVIRDPQVWLLSLYGALIFAPTEVLGGLWGNAFLIERYHITNIKASYAVESLFIGWIIGGPFWGWYSSHIGLRKRPLWYAAFGGLACLSAIIYAPMGYIGVLIASFGLGFFSSGFLPAFSIVRELNPSSISAAAMGIVNTFNMLGAAWGQALVSKLLDYYWSGALKGGVHVYQVQDFQLGFNAMIGMMLIGLVCLFKVKETHCQVIESAEH